MREEWSDELLLLPLLLLWTSVWQEALWGRMFHFGSQFKEVVCCPSEGIGRWLFCFGGVYQLCYSLNVKCLPVVTCVHLVTWWWHRAGCGPVRRWSLSGGSKPLEGKPWDFIVFPVYSLLVILDEMQQAGLLLLVLFPATWDGILLKSICRPK